MKTYLDCYPCFPRQALSAARRAGASTEQQRGIVLETMDRLKAMPQNATPPDMADGIHRLVRARTRNPDPYRQSKEDATRQALALLPRLRELVRAADDPLNTAVRIAIAGNIIDHGSNTSGTLLARCSRDFRKRFDRAAPIILAALAAGWLTDRLFKRQDRFLVQHLWEHVIKRCCGQWRKRNQDLGRQDRDRSNANASSSAEKELAARAP